MSRCGMCFAESCVTEDDKLYCGACFTKYNADRFWRPNYHPNARVEPEYNYIPERPKRKRDDVQKIPTARMSLPKTEAYALRSQPPTEPSIAPDHNKPTILELAREKKEHIVACALRNKHPHPKDDRIRLDDEGTKHDYYVVFDENNPVPETEFIQSTSSMIHQYFPNDVPSPKQLLFGKKTEDDEQLSQFATTVLGPLAEFNSHKYDQFCFVDAILQSPEWGPSHPKYGNYYSDDIDQLVTNLQQMIKDWEQKADDASTRGTFVHYLIELDMNGQIDLSTHPIYSQPHLNHIQQYLTWKREKFDPDFEPYRTEMQLFESEHRRVGTCDLVAVRKDHPPPSETNGVLRVKLIDWKNTVLKTKGRFDKEKGFNMGIAPMDKVHHCNLRHYELQQAEYASMLMKYYRNFTFRGQMYERMEFTSRELVCFDDSNSNNRAIPKVLYNDFRKELDIIWAKRLQDVAAWRKDPSLACRKVAKITNEQCVYLLKHLICKNKQRV